MGVHRNSISRILSDYKRNLTQRVCLPPAPLADLTPPILFWPVGETPKAPLHQPYPLATLKSLVNLRFSIHQGTALKVDYFLWCRRLACHRQMQAGRLHHNGKSIQFILT